MQSYSLLMLLVAIIGVVVWGYVDAIANKREEPTQRVADVGANDSIDQSAAK